MADSTAMTIEFLRARLLSERSVSKSARERADQLAKRVQELEEQLRVASFQRKQAEMATSEVLSILESRGFSDFAGAIDLYSDRENILEEGEEERKCDNHNSGEIRNGDEPSVAFRIDEGQEESEFRGKSLSWKSQTNSSDPSDKKKEEQSRQRQRMILLSRIGSSPQLSQGKSCRKFKKSLDEGTRKDDTTDEITKIDEAAVATLESSDNRENSIESDEAMERAIEQQDQLIDRFMAEENAQREWEQNYKDPREPENTVVTTVDDGETRGERPQQTESILTAEGMDVSQRFSDELKEEDEKEGDHTEGEKTASREEEPSCDITPPDHVGEMMTARPDESKDGSRQEEGETVECRSDGGRDLGEEWSLIQNPVSVADRPRDKSGIRAGNVLGALQRARLTLRQELYRLEPRREEIQPVGIPFGPRSLFRLPSDVDIEAGSSRLTLYPHGGFGEEIAVRTCTETRTSMAATFSRNLGEATMYGGLSSSFSAGETSRFGRRFAR